MHWTPGNGRVSLELPDEFSLHYLEKDGWTMFSTLPLSREAWKPVPFTQLLAFRQGRLIREGTVHGNEYEDNPENIKFLYQIFADL